VYISRGGPPISGRPAAGVGFWAKVGPKNLRSWFKSHIGFLDGFWPKTGYPYGETPYRPNQNWPKSPKPIQKWPKKGQKGPFLGQITALQGQNGPFWIKNEQNWPNWPNWPKTPKTRKSVNWIIGRMHACMHAVIAVCIAWLVSNPTVVAMGPLYTP